MKTNQYQPPFARGSQLQELARQQIGCVYNAERAAAKAPAPAGNDAAKRYGELATDLQFQRRAAGGRLPPHQEARFASEMDAQWALMSESERRKADPNRAAPKAPPPLAPAPARVQVAAPPPRQPVPAAAPPPPPVVAAAPEPARAPEPAAPPPAPTPEPEAAASPADAAPPADDGLDSMTLGALEGVARNESVPFRKNQTSRAALIQAIRSKRAQ